ncbi:uncharacterized protein LOC115744480 [Rhodamnia argentea]|uniref:Uncharacterized protein LOC115744480 n=1 Tax=Rhodamnia argentea TaxID=178133 RepID=A0A8B8PMF8_9MYRT|nr:uncharacterized protein LOC115744480 [Rhodamnia argentea]
MEFKYRAGASTSRPQPALPHSSDSGFFSDRAWRVDFPGTRNIRPYLTSELEAMRDPYLVRETIQREIEKQKIREEIIASEVARRQMLEDEVRRDLMLEQQMVLRRAGDGLPFDGKSAMWFGFNRGHPALHGLESRVMEDHLAYAGRNAVDVPPLPLIRSLEATRTEIKPELSKDRLIMLPRPDPNLSRAKRKASTSPAVAGELSTFSRKKKNKEEWTCALCQVSATSEKGLKEHLEGKKHWMKEASLAQKIGKEGNTESQVIQELEDLKKLSMPKMAQKLENTEGPRKNKNFQFWCEMCQIGAFAKTVMESHKKGKKHIGRLRELGQADEAGCAAVSRASATSDTEQNVTTAYAAAEDPEKDTGAKRGNWRDWKLINI